MSLRKLRIVGPSTFVLQGLGQNLLRSLELPWPARAGGLRTCWRRIRQSGPGDWISPANAKNQPGGAVTIIAGRASRVAPIYVLSRLCTLGESPSSMVGCGRSVGDGCCCWPPPQGSKATWPLLCCPAPRTASTPSRVVKKQGRRPSPSKTCVCRPCGQPMYRTVASGRPGRCGRSTRGGRSSSSRRRGVARAVSSSCGPSTCRMWSTVFTCICRTPSRTKGCTGPVGP